MSNFTFPEAQAATTLSRTLSAKTAAEKSAVKMLDVYRALKDSRHAPDIAQVKRQHLSKPRMV
jgi:hypothetical protein